MKRFLLLGITLLLVQPILVLADIDYGERIYREGRLPNDRDLVGIRPYGEMLGKDVACMNCHRSSGLGSVEGNLVAPPITGKALGFLENGTSRVYARMNVRTQQYFNQPHEPYDFTKFARALKEGIGVDGHRLNDVMPKYQISDNDVHFLLTYLTNLSSEYSPGADDEVIHFATVITPDADSKKKQLFLELLNKRIIAKNASTIPGQANARRHMVTAAELIYGTERKWDVDVWELEGDASTWERQLISYYDKKPVFALVSGLGADHWEPVGQFCESRKIPCWFPSTNTVNAPDFSNYSLYFNRGEGLEADLILGHIKASGLGAISVRQVYGAQKNGLSGATRLAEALSENLAVSNELMGLDHMDNQAWTDISQLTEHDVLVLWLSAKELAAFTKKLKTKARIYISGKLAGENIGEINNDLPDNVYMTYLYELPEKRRLNLEHFYAWMRSYEIKIEDEPFQAEVYFAWEYLADTLTEMLNNLHREYLLDRARDQLSINQSAKSEDRAFLKKSIRPPRKDIVLKPDPDMLPSKNSLEFHVGTGSTTIYPRMSLGQGQSFASRGGYIVKWEKESPQKVIPVTDWVVPDRN